MWKDSFANMNKLKLASVQEFLQKVLLHVESILQENFVGFYLHGSLAMNCFNPSKSDVDILVITKTYLTTNEKRELANLFLSFSTKPFPIEVSFLTINQLQNWQHPCLYDFHFSEFWRARYEKDLEEGTYNYINETENVDSDLAAHITILNQRGLCLKGTHIKDVFPSIPRENYIDSIMGDFLDCIEEIEYKPIYCALNLIRVYLFLKEDVITSKLEAGVWGKKYLPEKFKPLIEVIVQMYSGNVNETYIDNDVLLHFRDYIKDKVYHALSGSNTPTV